MTGSVRRAFTAADVRAASAAGRREVALPPEALVTPLARDTAAELDVALVPQPSGPSGAPARGGDLEEQVRRIVAGLVASAAPGGAGQAGRVKHVDARTISLERFPHEGPEPGQDVFGADVVTSADGSPVAAGFLTLTRGCFPWTLTYDEIQYVVEGELHIGLPAATVVGRPGDVLYIPKDTAITFGTPSWAKFFYATFPADWEASLP